MPSYICSMKHPWSKDGSKTGGLTHYEISHPALWVRIQPDVTQKIQNERHKQRNGKHSPPSKKIYQKDFTQNLRSSHRKGGPRICTQLHRWLTRRRVIDIFCLKRAVQHTSTQFCGSGMFISDPGSEFFYPGSRIQGQKDSGSWMPGPKPDQSL